MQPLSCVLFLFSLVIPYLAQATCWGHVFGDKVLAWQGEPLQGEETNNPRDALYNQQVSRVALSMPKPLVFAVRFGHSETAAPNMAAPAERARTPNKKGPCLPQKQTGTCRLRYGAVERT